MSMKTYGIKEKGDVKYFYTLRGLWIKAFVETINSDFEYVEEKDGLMLVRRVKYECSRTYDGRT